MRTVRKYDEISNSFVSIDHETGFPLLLSSGCCSVFHDHAWMWGGGGGGGKEERKKRESERGRRGGGKIDSRPGVEAKRRENLTVRGPKAT